MLAARRWGAACKVAAAPHTHNLARKLDELCPRRLHVPSSDSGTLAAA